MPPKRIPHDLALSNIYLRHILSVRLLFILEKTMPDHILDLTRFEGMTRSSEIRAEVQKQVYLDDPLTSSEVIIAAIKAAKIHLGLLHPNSEDMSTDPITSEQIPGNMPEWAEKATANSTFWAESIRRVAQLEGEKRLLEEENKDLREANTRILTRILDWPQGGEMEEPPIKNWPSDGSEHRLDEEGTDIDLEANSD